MTLEQLKENFSQEGNLVMGSDYYISSRPKRKSTNFRSQKVLASKGRAKSKIAGIVSSGHMNHFNCC